MPRCTIAELAAGTRDNMTIDWTKPNREADAWIAENVMEWRRVEPETAYFWPTPEMVEQVRRDHPDVLAVTYFPAPEFTSDISAAWIAESHIADPNHELHWLYDLAIAAILIEKPTRLSPLLRCKAMYRAICAHRKRKENEVPGGQND